MQGGDLHQRLEVVELAGALGALRRVEPGHGLAQADVVAHRLEHPPGVGTAGHEVGERPDVGGQVGHLGAGLGIVETVGHALRAR